MHWDLFKILYVFNLHLTAKQLCTRLNVAESTLRHWLLQEGGLSMRSLLLWARAFAVVTLLGESSKTNEEVAEALAFGHVESMSRTVWRASRMHSRELRSADGYGDFVLRMQRAFLENRTEASAAARFGSVLP